MHHLLDNILFVIALVMVIEGIFPFLSPTRWKRMLLKMMTIDDRSLRAIAFIMMVVGVAILSLIDPAF